ncbi:hypothetical protein PFICI_12255 [Pestalotiopsis fici W106-1]|uniref:LysM domain-containing protein n=1 Tax=Pestalotiopsis fici (strain W106-1 / CGMCC3.15140) TaxID=1229662 RepID=W3WR68_PESFW|nr:uncharacterized protein PFICI_12255 [Pestalotiopsis fici W106-1]ETS75311.1 hypothetical protein PFICI_12255 [Pestalotiopsis fici W106-1]
MYLSFASVQAAALLLGVQAVFAQESFILYNATKLDITLGTECVDALSAAISCNSYVRTFLQLGWRGSLGDVAFTDSVCSGACSASLKGWFGDVTNRCQGKQLDKSAPNRLGGYLWAGFNETCVKDPRTKQYCNDIIANFSTVPDYKHMPRTELCHTCHIRRLALMQSSQYSIYNDYYKEVLQYVYATCGGSGPTNIPPPLTEVPTETPLYCVTGKHYTTTRKGETCESIANATSVSSAALYMGNQALIPDCRDINSGVNVCLPLTCQTYYVRPSDTCVSIETALELEFGQVRNFNQWINFDCSNLQVAAEFWGRSICVSPQGGTFTGTVPAPAPTTAPLGDGYTRNAVEPPAKKTVASGTTMNCGKWHVVASGDTCSAICIQEGIEAGLFRLVNPSLSTEACTASLKPDSALCVGPTYSWNLTVPATTTMSLDSGVFL